MVSSWLLSKLSDGCNTFEKKTWFLWSLCFLFDLPKAESLLRKQYWCVSAWWNLELLGGPLCSGGFDRWSMTALCFAHLYDSPTNSDFSRLASLPCGLPAPLWSMISCHGKSVSANWRHTCISSSNCSSTLATLPGAAVAVTVNTAPNIKLTYTYSDIIICSVEMLAVWVECTDIASCMLYVESDVYLNTQMCRYLLAALRHTKWFRVMYWCVISTSVAVIILQTTNAQNKNIAKY